MYGQELVYDPVGVIDYSMLIGGIKMRHSKQSDSYFEDKTLNYDLVSNKNQKDGQNENEGEQSKGQLIELMFTMIATCH